jgi:hypothetical protein
MAMRSALLLAIVTAATPAVADTFGGFSGVDRPYLVNKDRVCAPLPVAAAAASGRPACETQPADVIAKLSIKPPIVQRGVKASFAALAEGKQLTVTRKSGEPVVTWSAPDPIGRVVEVYASQYEDRVAVAYTTRRLGKEVTDIVAFELVKTTGRDPAALAPRPVDPAAPPDPPDPAAGPASADHPELAKAVTAARKATKAKARAAWQAVLALDAQHAEAIYRIAALQLAAKQRADALASLGRLGKSARSDAIEWLVEARFDTAFAALRAEPAFRATVGLDRNPATPYERLMGFGGQWEQTGTSCEDPEVKLSVNRDRTFKLRVRSRCRGSSYDLPFSGTWRLDGDAVVLVLPTKGKQATAKDEAPCTFEAKGDEDALRCTLDRDLEFVVLPTRR